jgi:CheY-like chemotaxis protein
VYATAFAVNSDSPRTLRILIADDNRDSAEGCAILLQLDGHEVGVAYSGNEALAMGAKFRPHVMLCDLGMSEMDGYTVARHVRSYEWGSAVVLVAVTGYGQPADMRRTRDVGFDDHLVKPVELSSLKSLLKKCADGQG